MVPAYLYKITNSVNSKVYIGMTIDPERSWKEHCRGSTGCRKLVNAFNKHGTDKFDFTILAKGSIEYISELEMKAIIAYNSVDSGYNIHHGSTTDQPLLEALPSLNYTLNLYLYRGFGSLLQSLGC